MPSMTVSREDILTRLRTAIIGWKAEVSAGQEVLQGHIDSAGRQLSRLLEVLEVREEHTLALTAAREEVARLTALLENRRLPLPPPLGLENARRDILSSGESVAAAIAVWTAEVTHAHDGLSKQLAAASEQLNRLLMLLDSTRPPEPVQEANAPLAAALKQAQDTVRSLRDENAALQTHTGGLMSEITVLRQELAQYKQTLPQLEALVQEAVRGQDSLKEENTGYKTQLACLEGELARLRDAQSSSADYIAKLSFEHDTLLDRLREQEESLKTVLSQKTSLEEGLAEQTSGFHALQERLQEDLREHQALKEQYRHLTDQTETLRRQLEAATQQTVALEEVIEGKNSEIVMLQERLQGHHALQQEHHELAARADMLQEQCAALQTQVDALILQQEEQARIPFGSEAWLWIISAMRQELEDFETLLANAQHVHEHVAQALNEHALHSIEEQDGLRRQLENVQRALEEQIQHSEQAQTQVCDWRERAESYQAHYESSEQRSTSLEERLGAFQAEFSDLQTALDECRGQAASFQREAEASNTSLASALEESALLQNALTQARIDLQVSDTALHEARERVAALEETLRERDQALGELTEQASHTQMDTMLPLLEQLAQMETIGAERQQALEQLHQENGTLTTLLAETRSALSAHQSGLDEHTALVASLRDQVADREAQLENARQQAASAAAMIDELRGALNAMRQSEEIRLQTLAEHTEILARLEQERAASAAEKEMFSTQRRELESLVDTWRARASGLEEELLRLQSECEADRAAALEARKALQEAQASAMLPDDAIAEYEKALAELREALNAAQAQNDARGRAYAGSAGMESDSSHAAHQARAAAEQHRIVVSEIAQGPGIRPLGDILLGAGIVSDEQLREALKEQRRTPDQQLGAVLVRLEYATEEAIAQALACQLGMPVVRPNADTVEGAAAALLTREICTWHVCIPMRATAERLVVAMANPLDETATKKIEDVTRRILSPVIATPHDILTAIDDIYGAF